MQIRKRPIDGGYEITIYHPEKKPLVLRAYVRKHMGLWSLFQCYKGITHVTPHSTRGYAEKARDACISQIEDVVRRAQAMRKTVTFVFIEI